MRIYLSSYRFGKRSPALRTRRGRALIVLNALDGRRRRRLAKFRELIDLWRLGYRTRELDLREFWDGGPEKLEDRLRSVDLLWVVGGNTFVLTRAATRAGLAAALAEAPEGLTYGGYSAGACLASSDLTGMDRMDDDAFLPRGYPEDAPWNSLHLVDTRIVPHAGSRKASAVADALRRDGLAFVELADGEDWLIERSDPPAPGGR